MFGWKRDFGEGRGWGGGGKDEGGGRRGVEGGGRGDESGGCLRVYSRLTLSHMFNRLDIPPRLPLGSIPPPLGESANQSPAVAIHSPPTTLCSIEDHPPPHLALYPPRLRLFLRLKRPSKLFFPPASIFFIENVHKGSVVFGRKVALECVEGEVVPDRRQSALSFGGVGVVGVVGRVRVVIENVIVDVPAATGAPQGRVPSSRADGRPEGPAAGSRHGDVGGAGHAILCALGGRVRDTVGIAAGEGGEGADGGGEAVGVVGVEGGEVLVRGVEVGEVGEEVAGDDVGEGAGVGVFVEHVLLVQAAGAGVGAALYAGGGGAGEQRVGVGAEESVWHRGEGGWPRGVKSGQEGSRVQVQQK